MRIIIYVCDEPLHVRPKPDGALLGNDHGHDHGHPFRPDTVTSVITTVITTITIFAYEITVTMNHVIYHVQTEWQVQ